MKSSSLFPSLNFDNAFVRELPADPVNDSFRRQVTGACYSRVLPTPVAKPELVAFSSEVAKTLGMDVTADNASSFAQVFGGNELLAGMDPFAMCYGGHQFGNWAGQLGDGRAINLGEIINAEGQRWMLQLKGAGPTPYSRTADGLAVLRSSVREFLCSEAMHHLGVPTTRALSLVTTGEGVMRDMFYDGNPRAEPGAVVCRVAPSFTRFGNFQIFASRGDAENLRKLVDHTIRYDFPELGEPSSETYEAWFHEVCRRTADMIVHWMRVGFVHGVMNTDNMSILGQTIDYGPYGWLENYDPGWTPNTTDAQGRRYRYGHQPQIAQWNLMQLANALVSLFDDVDSLQKGLQVYIDRFESGWDAMMCAKLGLQESRKGVDESLFEDLLRLLQQAETDMTIFFRRLATIDCQTESCSADNAEVIRPLADAYYVTDQLTDDVVTETANWIRRYHARVRSESIGNEERRDRMHAVNPKYVLRNYLAQMAIDKSEQGDHSMISELLDVLRHPYDEQSDKEIHAAKRPDWARHRAGCSMLSCSS
ncbi:MAG: YdiU family protein [Pirellulaceae bacterium]